MPVRLELFDALGRPVRMLADQSCDEGTHTVFLNTADLTSGIYFYRLSTSDEGLVQKMVVFR
jgi:hypothetical protein